MSEENEGAASLKAIRLNHKLTQEEAANILGITRSTYINIESGRRSLTLDEMKIFCRALNISYSEFLNPENENDTRDYRKFKQIYLYILRKYFSEDGVPKTKLAKLLYLVDFTNFFEKLESMSKVKYIRRTYGPVADPFFELTDIMYDEGEIKITPLNKAQMIKPSWMEYDFSLLSDEDKELIDRVCTTWKNRSTQEIVAFTHSQKPWKECRDGEEIPYSLIIQEEPDHVYEPYTLQ